MLVGALCYAELGASFPDEGGEYHYLRLAWGRRFGLMFAWARGTVIQTGAIAAVAFIYGDYAQRLMPWATTAARCTPALSGIADHAQRVRHARVKRVQIALSSLTLVAVIGVMLAGLLSSGPSSPAAIEPRDGGLGMLGMGMVFVLLTYGGWNETAYLSGELRNPARNMGRVLLLGTLLVTTLYLLTNLALLQIFGLQALSQSDAIGADLMEIVAGSWAAQGLSLLICFTALQHAQRDDPHRSTGVLRAGPGRAAAASARGVERAWLDARTGIAGTGDDHPAADPVRRAEPERRAGDGRLHRAGILVLHVHDGAVAAATAPAGGLGATAIPRALVPLATAAVRQQLPGLFVSSTLYAGPARCWGCWSLPSACRFYWCAARLQ